MQVQDLYRNVPEFARLTIQRLDVADLTQLKRAGGELEEIVDDYVNREGNHLLKIAVRERESSPREWPSGQLEVARGFLASWSDAQDHDQMDTDEADKKVKEGRIYDLRTDSEREIVIRQSDLNCLPGDLVASWSSERSYVATHMDGMGRVVLALHSRRDAAQVGLLIYDENGRFVGGRVISPDNQQIDCLSDRIVFCKSKTLFFVSTSNAQETFLERNHQQGILTPANIKHAAKDAFLITAKLKSEGSFRFIIPNVLEVKVNPGIEAESKLILTEEDQILDVERNFIVVTKKPIEGFVGGAPRAGLDLYNLMNGDKIELLGKKDVNFGYPGAITASFIPNSADEDDDKIVVFTNSTHSRGYFLVLNRSDGSIMARYQHHVQSLRLKTRLGMNFLINEEGGIALYDPVQRKSAKLAGETFVHSGFHMQGGQLKFWQLKAKEGSSSKKKRLHLKSGKVQ